MDTVITIKCSPKEYDLIRTCVRSHWNALQDEQLKATSPGVRHATSEKIREIHELDQRL